VRLGPKPNVDTISDEDDYGYYSANTMVTPEMVDKGKAKAIDLDLNEGLLPGYVTILLLNNLLIRTNSVLLARD
jgi:hypothetical protein